MLLPRPPQWRRVTTPFALALVSLVAAVSLWVAVTGAENPQRVATFGGAIEIRAVNVAEGLAVKSIREPAASLTVSAAEDVLKRLTSADFRAEVDLSGVRSPASEQVVIARVVGKREVEIVDVSPSIVTVELEPAATRQVPVRPNLIGSLPQGYQIGAIEPTPASVRVTGAASLVPLIDSAVADINLTGLRVTMQQQITLIPRDVRGADIKGVLFDPPNADLKVGIVQRDVTLTLTIVPAVQGSVADGYNLVAVTSDPPAIAVSGALDLLQAQSFISTDPVDASGLRADVVRTVRLKIPAGLQATRDSVSVRLRVIPALGEITMTLAPQVTGLGEGLRATLQTPTLTLRLSGEMPTLRSLSPSSVRAVVNATGLDEGVHVLPPTVTPPDGVQVAGFDPGQLVVVLRR